MIMMLLEPLKRADFFGQPLPQGNIDGQEKVRTHFGGLVSLVFAYITLLFAFLKLQHLLTRHNPQVNSYVEEGVFDTDERLRINEHEDFMIAF